MPLRLWNLSNGFSLISQYIVLIIEYFECKNFIIGLWIDSHLSLTHDEATVALLFWTNPHPLRSWPYYKPLDCRVTSSHVNLLLVRSHQAEIIIVKLFIQGINNVIRVRIEPRSCNQGRRKNDIFTLSATLPTIYTNILCSTKICFQKFCNLQ